MSIIPSSSQARGQGLVEYALLLALAAGVLIGGMRMMGPTIGNVFSKMNSNMNDNNGVPPTTEPTLTLSTQVASQRTQTAMAWTATMGALTPTATLVPPTATATNIPPSATPTATPVPNWIHCAGENGFCSFSGTALVRYGANGVYATGTYTDGVSCSNSIFGDPLYGVVKGCDYLQ